MKPDKETTQKSDGKTASLSIRELYPHFTEKQLKEADENLERYIETVLRIYSRTENGSI